MEFRRSAQRQCSPCLTADKNPQTVEIDISGGTVKIGNEGVVFHHKSIHHKMRVNTVTACITAVAGIVPAVIQRVVIIDRHPLEIITVRTEYIVAEHHILHLRAAAQTEAAVKRAVVGRIVHIHDDLVVDHRHIVEPVIVDHIPGYGGTVEYTGGIDPPVSFFADKFDFVARDQERAGIFMDLYGCISTA